MGLFDEPEVDDVRDVDSFLRFVNRFHGTPVGVPGRTAFYAGFKRFLEDNPEWKNRIGWPQLAKACLWATKSKAKLRSPAGVLFYVADAARFGAIPELKQKTESELVDEEFYRILAIEEDPSWRDYLLSVSGTLRRQAVLDWKSEHG